MNIREILNFDTPYYTINREERNLADEYPEIVEEMLAEMRNWQESVLSSLTGADYE